ncbi:hypothetical protein [Wenyingzhuangia sp. IMCC45574]
MKKTLQVLLLLMCGVGFSQNVSISQAISITNKQSMLSQKIANEKMLNLGKETGGISESSSSVIQFEQNLEILGKTSFDSEIMLKLKTIELQWAGYKEVVLSKATTSNRKILLYSAIMLESCKNANKALLKEAEKKKEYPYKQEDISFVDAFNAANEIKTLSQQLPFYINTYFSELTEFHNDNVNNSVKEIIAKMEVDLEAISKLNPSDEMLIKSIDTLKSNWDVVKSNLDQFLLEDVLTSENHPESVKFSSDCNNLLKKADYLVRTLKSSSEIK